MNGQLEKTISIDAANVPNAVLKRLIEEVRHDHNEGIYAYNRTHNRHNRSGSDRWKPMHTPQPEPTPKPEPKSPSTESEEPKP